MDFIGHSLTNLNFLRLQLGLFFGMLFIWGSPAWTLERTLSTEEVTTLEKNLLSNPNNINSRRFLLLHYSREKQWKKAVAAGQPAQAELTRSELLLLMKAQMEAEDADALLATVGYFQGKFKSSAHTKLLEGRGHHIEAKNEMNPAKRREIAVKAIDSYKQAIKIDPSAKEAYFAWLATLKEFWTQYHDDALQIYKQLLVVTENKDTYLAEQCELFVQANLWNEAVETCTQSTQVFPEKTDSYAHLSTALLAKGDKEKAQAVLTKSLRRSPSSFQSLSKMGDYYYKENNFVEAADHYRRALAADPQSSTTYLGLALSEFQQKKYTEALLAFHQNCWLSKKVAKEFINATGQLRNNLGFHDRYKRSMNSCIEIKPSF